MHNFILKRKNLIPIITVTLFFVILVSVGLLIFRDYGISSDEVSAYLRGQLNYVAFKGGSLQDFSSACAKLKNICYYPPLYSMLAYRLVPAGDSQTIYQRLHLVDFLAFAGAVFVFFLIGKKIFKNWMIALLGCLFLVISPRIFGHAFYNPKDLPFMDAYIVSIYTMLLFLEKKNLLTALLHGVAIAVACGIRTPGVVIFPITFVFYGFDLFLAKKGWKDYLKGLGLFISSILVAAGLVYWFTPYLYDDPITKYIQVFNLMKNYTWDDHQTYLGVDIRNKIPWHYSLVWFSVSSPPFYVGLFGLGSVVLIMRSLRSRLAEHFQALRDMYLVAACGIVPIITVIIFKSVIYSDNRQMYFCYPPLLLISIYGLRFLIEKLREINLHWQVWASVIIILGLVYPVYFMVQYHTHENVFFNFFAGPRMSVVATRFSMDRWGLASKDALEYILKTDTSHVIHIQAQNGIIHSYLLLPKAERDRLIVSNKGPAKYLITLPIPAPTKSRETIYYNVNVFDAPIMSVYLEKSK